MCSENKGCLRHPIGCDRERNCTVFADTELVKVRDKTVLKFHLSWVSETDNDEGYVALLLAKQRQLGPNTDDIMIVCHHDKVITLNYFTY